MLRRRGRLGSFKGLPLFQRKLRFHQPIPIQPTYYKAPPKKNRKIILWRGMLPILVAIVMVISLLYATYNVVDGNLKPTITRMATTTAHQIAVETINQTLYEEILPQINYSDLIIIHKNAQNQISFIQANSLEIGKIVTKTGREIKKALLSLPDETIQIPIGQVLGINILANRGPKLAIKLTPIGTVDVVVSEKFEQAGINQVKHTIYIEVSTQVSIVVPLVSKEEPIKMKMPIAESIIVGPVPETYFGGGIPLQNIGPSTNS
jgi:sporulation protein YunB